MKFEKISNNKIKVIISPDDSMFWNLSSARLDISNEANSVFWEIIHQAEQETGIAFENCKLTIEALQKDDSTFILFITRAALINRKKIQPKSLDVKKPKNKPYIDPYEDVYEFGALDDIIDFINTHPYFAVSMSTHTTLYKYKDLYYLAIEVSGLDDDLLDDFDITVSEFANPTLMPFMPCVLQEHGQVLISGTALEDLYKNF